MLFNSYIFIFAFLPCALAAYWIFEKRSHHTAILCLTSTSYLFYFCGEPVYPWLIVTSIVVNFYIGVGIAKFISTSKLILVSGIVGNLLLLGYMKYYNFARSVLHTLWNVPMPVHSITLPIGISFFTFTQIAYLVDVYMRDAMDSDLLNYFLFVTFFPHLIAGPILHHKEMMPQFRRATTRHISKNIAEGLAMFTIGLFKKVMIADMLAQGASPVFDSVLPGVRLQLVTAWMAALAYTAQIYFDFSGYTDMAIGVGKMFGIDLPINFNSPYKSVSIADFWRRWHITLSRFLRDYLYIPMGGSRKGNSRHYLNLLLTMVLGGIWHGAGWTFLLWGFLHGVFLFINHLFTRLTKGWVLGTVLPSRILTFLCVVFAWVPFRANNIATVITFWRAMLGVDGFGIPDISYLRVLAVGMHLKVITPHYALRDTCYVLIALLVCFALPNSQQVLWRFNLGLDSKGYNAKPHEGHAIALRFNAISAIIVGILLGTALRCIGSYSEFIYYHF